MTPITELAASDIVIFGGTGDLAFRKLLPALFLRMADGQLPRDSRIVAASRAGLDDAGYRDKVLSALHEFVDSPDPEDVLHFLTRLTHVSLDIDDADGWDALRSQLLDAPREVRVFYLAVGPALFGTICQRLSAAGLVTAESRVVLEKPIGTDIESARAINDAVDAVFDESQIFRIDHYLGKESVQNLLVTRFANAIFEPLWNARAIDHVQITVAETLGVGSRGGYYDSSGAMRDMIQNHLLQILCLVAMEPPACVAGEAVRNEKLKVLQALRPLVGAEVSQSVVFGQYAAGEVDGEAVPAYVDELVPTNGASRTETFVALRAEISNWRWAGVPFYLRTGKRLAARESEIVIVFRPAPHPMFPDGQGSQGPNRLVLRLQPEESVHLQMLAKEPGPGGIRTRPVSLDLNLAASGAPSPDAYERLLMDVVRGTPTLFMRRDEIEAAWRWVEPIIDHHAGSGAAPAPYPAGSTGPAEASALLERDGRTWYEETDR
ncbi:glucose-6-phosphate dehydrogenase [Nocardioides montaniterrae]